MYYNILIIHSLNFVQDDVVLQSSDVETSRSNDGDITSISEAEDILQHGIMGGDICIGNLQRESCPSEDDDDDDECAAKVLKKLSSKKKKKRVGQT